MPTADDYLWLASPAAAEYLAAAAEDGRPLLARLTALRQTLGPDRAAAIVELVEQRTRGAVKFGALAPQLFGTTKQWQQATDGWIAAYKAERFAAAGAAHVHDFCCGMGGDLMALASRVPTTGWDRDEVAARFAEANLAAWRDSDEGRLGTSGASPQTALDCSVQCADVADAAPAADEAWHVDPDRRRDGRRTTTPELHSPRPEAIDRWLADCPHGAVKLAPATRPWGAWSDAAEWEWISRERECKQLVAWFGNLRRGVEPGVRRATRITAVAGDGFAYGAATFSAAPVDAKGVAEEPGPYVVEPDPAVIAAELVGSIANEAQLATLGAGGAYLTGDAPPSSPLLTTFVVVETLPLRPAKIIDALNARSIGSVEVKVRGVKQDPTAFRRRLKIRGDNAAVVVLTRIGRRELAIIAERVA